MGDLLRADGIDSPRSADCDRLAHAGKAYKLWRRCSREFANCARKYLTSDLSAEQRVRTRYGVGEERSDARSK
jgi:hypothetical protein